jgi:hemolysin III
MGKGRICIKEPFCGISHGLGAAMSVAGLVVLLVVSAGKPWKITSFAIYGATLIILYTASALYHSISASPHVVERLKRLDHIGIYLLIAGTYTPVCLVVLGGAWGWGILAAEYAMAALGITATLFLRKVPNWLRVALYLCMGWLIVIALSPLQSALPSGAMAWMTAGGIIYTVGTVIYATDRPNLWPGKFTAHDLWHVFVLAGSLCHYVMMLGFVA